MARWSRWRRTALGALAVAAALAGLGHPVAPAAAGGQIRPPVMPEDRPDPELVHDGTRWLAYSTNTFWEGNVPVLRSSTLGTWTFVRDALPTLGSWASEGFTWSPGVAKMGSTWVMYYTALHTQAQRQCIGRAVASSATGPFVDRSAAPLICQLDRGGSIDADPYVAPDGSPWIVWKSDDNALGHPTSIWMQALASDGLSLSGAPAVLLTAGDSWQHEIVENPSLANVGGQLWLFYSGGWWDDAGYAMGYATCTVPLAPCADQTPAVPWLSFGATGYAGVGGGTVLTRPGVAPLLAFHGWTPTVGYEQGGVRSAFIEPLDFSGGAPTWSPDLPRTAALPPPPSVGVAQPVLGDWSGFGADGIGVYWEASRRWQVKDEASAGQPDLEFGFGGPGDLPVVGDWDGDGVDGIGVYRPSTREWFLRQTASGGGVHVAFGFGGPGDLPVVGDWDGDGVDGIGVYRPSTREWFLRQTASGGSVHVAFGFGGPDDVPIVGDWSGKEVDGIGVFRPSTRTFYVRETASGGGPHGIFGFGGAGDLPLIGDWIGGGADELGVLRPSTATWYLRHTLSSGGVDSAFEFGPRRP